LNAGNVIETHEHKGDFKEPEQTNSRDAVKHDGSL